MLNYWYSLRLVTETSDTIKLFRWCACLLITPSALRLRFEFGIMSKHARHLTYFMVSAVTVTTSNEYQ